MNPTKKQKILLDFIDGFVKGRGYSPTLREIMQALGYKSVSTVAKHVDNLIARGWLVKRDGEARSLEVLDGLELKPQDISESDLKNYVRRIANKKLADSSLSDADREVIKKSLELLGFDEGLHEIT